MRAISRLAQITIAAVLGGSTLSAAATLTLDPTSGNLSGVPGETVGWGFTIFNDTNYLVVSGVQFLPVSLAGSFVDLIGAQFNVLGPAPESSTWSQTWNGVEGLGSFVIDAGAPAGLVIGQLFVGYDLFSVSPNSPTFNPDTDSLGAGQFFEPITVSIQINSQVPEPAGWLTVAASLAVLGFLRQRR
jgi:hypothetical protein